MATTPQKKSAAGRKKAPASRKSGAPFDTGMKALGDAGVPNDEIGRLNEDGTHTIDSVKVEALKKKLGKKAWSNVRFIAMNAPFKRRAQIPQA
jgi:hypothetical protein